jgi:hypothetical protein
MPAYVWSLGGSSPSMTSSIDVGSVAAGVGLVTHYGIDITTWAKPGQTEPDLDPNFTIIPETSKRCVTETVARALCTPRGSMEDAPNNGYDLRSRLNSKWMRRDLFNVQTSSEGEALKDERVYSASASIKWNARSRQLDVRLIVDCMVGSFPLVLAISDVSVEILRSQ